MTTGTCNQRGEGLRGEETVLGTEPLIWGIWCCLHGDRFRTESTLQVTQRVSDNCLVWGKNAKESEQQQVTESGRRSLGATGLWS